MAIFIYGLRHLPTHTTGPANELPNLLSTPKKVE